MYMRGDIINSRTWKTIESNDFPPSSSMQHHHLFRTASCFGGGMLRVRALFSVNRTLLFAPSFSFNSSIYARLWAWRVHASNICFVVFLSSSILFLNFFFSFVIFGFNALVIARLLGVRLNKQQKLPIKYSGPYSIAWATSAHIPQTCTDTFRC